MVIRKRECNLDDSWSDFYAKRDITTKFNGSDTCCGQSVYYKEGLIIALQQDQTDCF